MAEPFISFCLMFGSTQYAIINIRRTTRTAGGALDGRNSAYLTCRWSQKDAAIVYVLHIEWGPKSCIMLLFLCIKSQFLIIYYIKKLYCISSLENQNSLKGKNINALFKSKSCSLLPWNLISPLPRSLIQKRRKPELYITSSPRP